MKIDAQLIGNKIRQYRKKNNLTQEQLAELADISVVYVSKLEHGQRIPSLETLIEICNDLNCSLDVLFAEHLHITDSSSQNKLDALMSNATNADRKFLSQLIAALRNYL